MPTCGHILFGPKKLAADDDLINSALFAQKTSNIRNNAKKVLIVSAIIGAIALIVLLGIFAAPALPIIGVTAAGIAAAMGGVATGSAAAAVLGISVLAIVLSSLSYVNNSAKKDT